GEHVGLLEVLRGQEDGDAVLAREPSDLGPEGRAALRVEAGRRLVEEEHARAVDQRERQVEAALHPAGVALDLAVGSLHQADALEQLVGAGPAFRAWKRLESRLESQMLASGQQPVERGLLERCTDRRAYARPLVH